MANILKKWIESDRRELRRINKIANKVESYAKQMSEHSFRQKLMNFGNVIKRVNPWIICCQKHSQFLVKGLSGS